MMDAGGALIAYARMDGARFGNVDIAINKAWTARAFDMSAEDLARVAQSGAAAFGIHSTHQPRLMIFGGSGDIPISLNGAVIGAVGTSCGSVEQVILTARGAMAEFDDSH